MSVTLRPATDPSRAIAQAPRPAPEKPAADAQAPKADAQAPEGGQTAAADPSKAGPQASPRAAADPSAKADPLAQRQALGLTRGGLRAAGPFGAGGPFGGPKVQQGWGPPHQINQLNPKGADENYKNALFNCGPAVVAMLAKESGKFGDMTDAQLVSQLGNGVVSEKGTDAQGIAQMMDRADLKLGGDALGAGYSEKDLQSQLQQGHKLIAQVRSTNPAAQKDAAHYVVVEGMTRDGNYVISDPLAKGPYAVKPEQLKEAVLKAPPDGGMLIPVAAPGENADAAAPAAAANPTATPEAVAAAAVAKQSDGFSDPDLRAAEARRVTDPNGIRVADVLSRAAPVDPSTVAVAGRVSNALGLPVAGLTASVGNGFAGPIDQAIDAGADAAQLAGGAVSPDGTSAGAGYDIPQQALIGPRTIAPSTVAQPAAPAATAPAAGTTGAPLIVTDPSVKLASDDKAFTANDAELAKVDNSFTDTSGAAIDQRLTQNDNQNNNTVNLTYGHVDEKPPAAAKADEKGSVFDGKMSVGDFIRNLLGLKEKGDQKAYDTLDKLEHSTNAKDKSVLNQFKHRDKHDHGIGSKRGWEDFGG